MTMARRERLRLETIEEIKDTAWKQIGEQGAASLSLRAIARQMGMTAPGLYRYYKDRDALVTALLMDAFSSFTTSLEAGRDSCALDDHAGRFRGMCRAYFQWAMENPQRYVLLFGTPVQGYLFAEEVGPVAQRSFLVLQGVIGEAFVAGKIKGEAAALKLPTSLKVQYEALRKMGMPYTPLVTHLALSTWNAIHGLTSLFLYGYSQSFLGSQVDRFVESEIERLTMFLGLKE
ncbi:MAG: TetR/AcrR family transcriptional regulator [Chloroflexi bacterium]|nr:TetR/AcrR family transcriptional regulator [Chloroflexota bacterium]